MGSLVADTHLCSCGSLCSQSWEVQGSQGRGLVHHQAESKEQNILCFQYNGHQNLHFSIKCQYIYVIRN